jgi:hypothetical protein
MSSQLSHSPNSHYGSTDSTPTFDVLCSLCQAIFEAVKLNAFADTSSPVTRYWERKRHSTFDSMRSSGKQGCHLCNLIVQAINCFYQGPTNYYSLPTGDQSVYIELNLDGDLSTISGKWGVLKISVGLSGIISTPLLTALVRLPSAFVCAEKIWLTEN